MLVEWLSSLDVCDIVSCTATEYGGELVDGLSRVASLVGPLDAQAKERLVAEHDFSCIVDATHPYATHVTESIAALAAAHELPRLRLQRDGFAEGPFTWAADVAEAAQIVADRPGNVMLTTGAKDLAVFVEALPDFAERLYVRILPVEASIAKARGLGIPAGHIIAMQGPFAVETNIALMRQFDIRTMVTKASGATGGFQEKIDAAAACSAELVVIQRPEEGEGRSFSEVQAELAKMLGVDEARLHDAEDGRGDGCESFFGGAVSGNALASGQESEAVGVSAPDGLPAAGGAPASGGVPSLGGALAPSGPRASDGLSACDNLPAPGEEPASGKAAQRTVYLVGIGLGDPDTLTVEAVKAIDRSELLIGAARMLEPYAERSCEKLALIKSDDIAEALRASDAPYASVLFSGDVGFYSGATALSQKLRGVEGLAVRAVPGISSVVCLCARLLTPWQDVHLVSAHGRECDPVAEVRTHAKTFMLTGGKTKARDVCAMLAEAGLGQVLVHVGERLSYDDERIVHGSAAELADQDFLDLAVMLVENPDAPRREPGKLEA